MTKEFINRGVSKLIKYQVDFMVAGSVSKYLRGKTISTLDLDIVVNKMLKLVCVTSIDIQTEIKHKKNELTFVQLKKE